jgi:hypothetical protein
MAEKDLLRLKIRFKAVRIPIFYVILKCKNNNGDSQ